MGQTREQKLEKEKLFSQGLKKCGHCLENKPLNNFPIEKSKRGERLYGWCKECKNEKAKISTKKFNQKHRDRVLTYEIKTREEKRAVIEEKYRLPCIKCGESRKYLIEFHHINPKDKNFAPLNTYQIALARIIEEIQKCVTLCCNCHREFHHFERLDHSFTIEKYLSNKL